MTIVTGFLVIASKLLDVAEVNRPESIDDSC